MVNRFILNELSYFGPGARKELPAVVSRLGFKKALVVTDKGLIKFGVAKMVTDVLDEAGIPYEMYSEVKPNPTVKNVQMGVDAFKASGADFMVAIGGGSAMDTAKGIGIVINNPEFADIVSLEGTAPTKHKAVPTIALPTTAGTAAETTINYNQSDQSVFHLPVVKPVIALEPNSVKNEPNLLQNPPLDDVEDEPSPETVAPPPAVPVTAFAPAGPGDHTSVYDDFAEPVAPALLTEESLPQLYTLCPPSFPANIST